MKIGDVVKMTDGLQVVKEIENGRVTKTERLAEYIARTTMVRELNGDIKPLREILEQRCIRYVQEKRVYEV